MRLRMLISHSLDVSAWPALPGTAFNPASALSRLPITTSSADAETWGLAR